MSNATSFARLGYMMLIKESPIGTAGYPTEPIELLSSDITVNWDFTPVNPIAGRRAANYNTTKNRVGPFEGTIEIYVEPKTIGHFLTGLLGEAVDTTLEATYSYQHDFELLNTLPGYTMDIKTANDSFVTRYFGVRIKSLKLSVENNVLKATIGVFAQRVFQNARVLADIGSGTTLTMDQTSGITTSDTIEVYDKDDMDTVLATLTVTSVDTEHQLTVSTIGVSLQEDDVVVIKAQSLNPSDYDLSEEMIWSGGAEAYISNGTDAIQTLAAKTNLEDLELSFETDMEARWAASGADVIDRMPSTIIMRATEVTGKFSQLHTNEAFLDMIRENERTGLRIQFIGQTIASNVASVATGVIETDGVGTVDVTTTATGEAGNDYAIYVVQGTGALSASISGKVITVTLAAVAGNNTTTLVASAINALTGVDSSSTGADLVTTTDNPDKIFFSGGRDANETELLRFDFPDIRFNPFTPKLGKDDTVTEDLEFSAYWDASDEREVQVRLRNNVANY